MTYTTLRTPRSLALLVAMICPLATAGTEIFKRELPDGTVIYSDQPHPDAVRIDPPPPQIIQSFEPPPRHPAPEKAPEPEDDKAYTRLVITSPSSDEVIWSNQGTIEVALALEPPLRVARGHTLVIEMDGDVVAETAGRSRLVLDNVFRGTHVLEARVRGADGETLIESTPVTFHLRQHSILAPIQRQQRGL